MKFRIEIDCSNDAFVEDPIGQIEEIISNIDWETLQTEAPYELALADLNGNTCGLLELDREKMEDEPDALAGLLRRIEALSRQVRAAISPSPAPGLFQDIDELLSMMEDVRATIERKGY